MFNWMSAIAEEVQSAPVQTSNGMVETIVMLVVMVAVFYFLMIRPQKKKDKAVRDMLSAIKAGDRICTIGGLYGTVTNAKDEQTLTISLGTLQNTIVIARWAVKSVENAPTENTTTPEV